MTEPSPLITSYIHCKRCLAEIPDGESARTWARFEVGFTGIGMQIWCTRHQCNVVHIDFEGAQHPTASGRRHDGEADGVH